MPRKRARPKDSLPRHRRKVHAEGLIYRYYLEKKTLAQCWLEVHPDSGASKRSRTRMASAEIEWYRRMYPLGVEALLYLKQMGVSELLDELKKLVHATETIKAGSVRVVGEDGSFKETYLFKERPALKIRLEAIRLWAKMLGLIAGGRKGVVPPGEKPAGGDPRNGTANGHGPPPRRIHGAEPMPSEEWMEDWEQLQEDRRQEQRDGSTDDGWD